ncbi:hypothetical protein BC826DRAFT_1009641 [Russula brevipes]|nr:hypothetical protein BC826DRAFT_1009641 [Russula brevipes]
MTAPRSRPETDCFHQTPEHCVPAIATVLAFPALSPTPSFIPLTTLVATLLIYTRVVIPRPHAPERSLHLSLGALSSTAFSIISLWLISSLSSIVAFSVVTLSDYITLRVDIPWAKIAFFPCLWATAWQSISHISPVGHLVTWSPVTGIAGYEWMRPLFGEWGINWIVGAWAIVAAEIVGAWFIGPTEELEPQGPLIPTLGEPEPEPRRSASLPGPRHILLLGAALLLLSTPSSFSPITPTLPWSISSTPISLGCILPHPPSPGDESSPLDRFIAESKQHNHARILLWPEAALKFETNTQREEAIKRVQMKACSARAEWNHSREGKWRNGLVLVGSNGTVAEFYKRNLVPIAESFSLTPSKDVPKIYELELQGSNKNKKWTPVPPYDRTISLTAAICLDFSSPKIFTSLDSTWHHDVSMAMWEQAKARAEEAGSMVLFCDGGAQGASGVSGHGIQEPVQFGSGSWTRTIGVEWPFNQRRTLYMWGGEALQVGIVWLLLGTGWATEALVLGKARGGIRGAINPFSRLGNVFGRARAFLRRGTPVQGEQQPLLL